MLSLTSKILNKDLSDSILTTLHQWRFVEAYKHPSEDYFIDPNLRIAVCGDWCVDSRVEGAFTSAYKLSQVLLEKIWCVFNDVRKSYSFSIPISYNSKLASSIFPEIASTSTLIS